MKSETTPRPVAARRVGLARMALTGCVVLFASQALSAAPLPEVIADAQPKIVKIYGAGGLQKLEAYQSGFLISAQGHVLTAWSYVLDTDYVTVTLDDGRKYQGEYVGHDPLTEIAVLKIDGLELPHFDLHQAVDLEPGAQVLAFSNLYGVATGDEPASVLHGVMSVRTKLAARRGAFDTLYQGEVYVLDAMTNNPGAAGGALTDASGQLAGFLGKELRNSQNNTWLNYAMPISELVGPVDDIIAGRLRPRDPDDDARKALEPVTLAMLGVTLVPDVLAKTPPFVDRVRPDSPAEKAGLRSDDLVLFVNNQIVASCAALEEELTYIDRIDTLRVVVQRDQELVELELSARN
ncbi:MAG: trypsin-like peptidase domain-containing protein [Pirellulaceae bacterium]